MKKEKIIYLLIAIALLFGFTSNVEAKKAVGNISNGNYTGIKASYNGANYDYKAYDFKVTDPASGKSYNAYCVDPGWSMGNNVSMNCNPVTNGSMIWLLDHLTGDRVVDNLAVRFLAIFIDMKKAPKGYGFAIVRYAEERNKYELGMSTDPTLYGKYLYGSDKIDKAYNLAKTARDNSSNVQSTSTALTFNVSSSTQNNVTLSVKSNNYIDSKGINFTCEGCQIVNKSWNGTSGTIQLKVSEPNCSYSVNAYYNAGGTYLCTAQGGYQNLVTKMTDVGFSFNNGNTNTTESAVQKFTGEIDAGNGGEYYTKYCENQKCTEKTKVEVPEYCDDDKDQNISITSPKNVQYCVLNNKDEASNTYKLSDGQIFNDNPYCAVYCKEDYKMTMPGAQYANSGRYFELKNTVVEATRTCYATNPDGNSSAPAMNIQKFVNDVKTKQQAVVDAYNAYKKAEKELELSGNPDPHSSTACGQTEYNYSISPTGYSGAKAVCDNTTGKCTFAPDTGSTSGYAWGTWLSESHPCVGPVDPKTKVCPTTCSANPSTVPIPDFAGNKARAESALYAAINSLKTTITHMEQCYNWTNNLCLNTEIEFNYEEQYSSDINYEQISLTPAKDANGTIVGKDATYGNTPTISTDYDVDIKGTLENINYLYCNTSGCNNSNDETKADNISTLATHYYYRKIETKGKAEYANTQQFQTHYPSGSIETVADKNSLKYNYSYLGAVFPIALNTSRGVYKWTLDYTQLGQYNDTGSIQCKNGRLDDVVKTINSGNNVKAELQYVCVYVVSCDDCDYQCVGEGCLIPTNPSCPECDVYCDNCIFDGNDTYTYQAKSLNEFNPSGRVLGTNWSNEKGRTTIQEIEEKGETIYVEAEDIYILTANQKKAIRDYNKQTGTYVALDLTYHDSNNIKNAYGTSDFLRDSKSEGKYFKTVKRNETWTFWENVGDNVGPAWK